MRKTIIYHDCNGYWANTYNEEQTLREILAHWKAVDAEVVVGDTYVHATYAFNGKILGEVLFDGLR